MTTRRGRGCPFGVSPLGIWALWYVLVCVSLYPENMDLGDAVVGTVSVLLLLLLLHVHRIGSDWGMMGRIVLLGLVLWYN